MSIYMIGFLFFLLAGSVSFMIHSWREFDKVTKDRDRLEKEKEDKFWSDHNDYMASERARADRDRQMRAQVQSDAEAQLRAITDRYIAREERWLRAEVAKVRRKEFYVVEGGKKDEKDKSDCVGGPESGTDVSG